VTRSLGADLSLHFEDGRAEVVADHPGAADLEACPRAQCVRVDPQRTI
jgi:hypothetical protein